MDFAWRSGRSGHSARNRSHVKKGRQIRGESTALTPTKVIFCVHGVVGPILMNLFMHYSKQVGGLGFARRVQAVNSSVGRCPPGKVGFVCRSPSAESTAACATSRTTPAAMIEMSNFRLATHLRVRCLRAIPAWRVCCIGLRAFSSSIFPITLSANR